MAYNVIKDGMQGVVSDINSWMQNYKEGKIEFDHDQSQYTLSTPDESIIVVGPPRLSQASTGSSFYVVGFVNSFQYSESAQVQPLKAIGSRRHIFSRTNAPVQGSIGRMIAYGPNLYRALYSLTDLATIKKNAKFAGVETGAEGKNWFSNLESDLFRIPFGIGIIYQSPTGMEQGGKAIGADYLEVCTLVNRSVGLQSGQTMIMEQVSFMADRVIPWPAYSKDIAFSPTDAKQHDPKFS